MVGVSVPLRRYLLFRCALLGGGRDRLCETAHDEEGPDDGDYGKQQEAGGRPRPAYRSAIISKSTLLPAS
jgi:hypothetical protein